MKKNVIIVLKYQMQILHLKEIELHIHFIDYLYFTLLKINLNFKNSLFGVCIVVFFFISKQ